MSIFRKKKPSPCPAPETPFSIREEPPLQKPPQPPALRRYSVSMELWSVAKGPSGFSRDVLAINPAEAIKAVMLEIEPHAIEATSIDFRCHFSSEAYVL